MTFEEAPVRGRRGPAAAPEPRLSQTLRGAGPAVQIANRGLDFNSFLWLLFAHAVSLRGSWIIRSFFHVVQIRHIFMLLIKPLCSFETVGRASLDIVTGHRQC